MKGQIVIPANLKGMASVLTDGFTELFRRISRLGLEITYCENLAIDRETSVVLIFAGAHGKMFLRDVPRIRKGVKVILYLGGPHVFRGRQDGHRAALNRANVILSASDELYRKVWPDYLKKYIFFPNFFAPRMRYTRLRLKKRPIAKCLISGNTAPQYYPLRRKIKEEISKDAELQGVFTLMRHPRFPGKLGLAPWEISPATRDAYARTLNTFFCALATASKNRYALAKHFEIPAAGTLLLANETADLKKAGFMPGTHFVPFDQYNVYDKVKACVANPSARWQMRREATEFVRAEHGVDSRVKQFKQILEGWL